MIKKLIEDFFQRIEDKEGITNKNGKSTFLIRELLEKKYGKFNYIEKQKATRLQKKYIEKDPNASASINDSFLKDVMAKYLDYNDYNDYVKQIKTKELIQSNWIEVIGLTEIPLSGYISFINPTFKNK